MKYYIEITLLPSADIGLYFLWEKIFQQVHLKLVEIKDSDGIVPVGISFPEYSAEKKNIGCKLRLFVRDQSILESLNIPKWLRRFNDYVHLTRIRTVPNHISAYACYIRMQTKSSKVRMARRKSKREGIDFEQALKLLNGYQEKQLNQPFITIASQSSGRRFHLFIQKQNAEKFIDHGFNSYGLSRISTVPEF